VIFSQQALMQFLFQEKKKAVREEQLFSLEELTND